MLSLRSLRRAAASPARVPRVLSLHVEKARATPRPAVAFARRFASKPTGPTPVEGGAPQQKVTRAMLVHEGREILKLMIGGVIVVSGLLASSGFVIETMKRVNPMPAPGRFLELQDSEGKTVQVHYQYYGDGDVTVVLDGGVGETSFDWDKVAQEVGKFTRVLAIDRPGLGFSTATASPRTAAEVAGEYATVMDKLGIRGKVVLVGHGAGGYNMRQLAENLEQDVSSQVKCEGLVLVDALQENLRAELESVSEPVRQALQTMDKNGNTVWLLSHIGFIRLINNIQRKKNEAKFSAEALPYVEFYTPTPAHRLAANEENRALPATEQTFRDSATATRGFTFPSIVLSHSRPDMFAGMRVQQGVDAFAVEALEQKWQNAQRQLAKSVGRNASSAMQIVVPDAGHCIHHEKPEAVVQAVRALVNEVREEGSATGLASLQGGSCPI